MAADPIFSGNLRDGDGVGTDGTVVVTKTGTGTQIFSGHNTYTGATTIDGGMLLVTGSTVSASAVTVNSGGVLGGTGEVAGTVSVEMGGELAPGASPGILSTGSVALDSGSVFGVELNGAAAGTGYDQLQVTGGVALGGPTLDASLGFVPALGDTFTLIVNDDTEAVVGTFDGLAEGATLTIGGYGFRISDRDGTGNDVVLIRNLAPTDIALSGSAVLENQPPGTVVGSLSAADADNPADAHTYSLAAGAGDDDNASCTIAGNQLKTADSFDYETKNSYSIRVRSMDQGGLWYEEALTIAVTDVDEIPPTVTGTTPSFAASGSIAAGTTSLRVDLSEPVVGGGTAANYQLQSLGADGLLGTADDAIIPVSASYGGATATLIFPALSESVYRLTVQDAITDAADNALDGDGNGTGGGDWVSDFVVLPGTGDLVYSTPTYSSGGSNPWSVALGDLNGDGRADLAVANDGSGNVGVLPNSQAFAFFSPHGLLFDVQVAGSMAGQLVNGSRSAFDGTNRLQVGALDYAPTAQHPHLQDEVRTLVLPAQALGGLSVHREITVPGMGNEDFARTAEVFENPTGAPITTTVRIAGNLGSDSATTVWKTSDGDTVIESTDQWLGTDDGADGSGTPAIVHYLHGPSWLQPTSVIRTGDNIEWTYNLTVPAGQTVRLAQFTILADTRAAAETAAGVLVGADAFGGQAAAFLTQEELNSIANFVYNWPPLAEAGGPYSVPEGGSVPLDGSGSTDPDLPLDALSYAGLR